MSSDSQHICLEQNPSNTIPSTSTTTSVLMEKEKDNYGSNNIAVSIMATNENVLSFNQVQGGADGDALHPRNIFSSHHIAGDPFNQFSSPPPPHLEGSRGNRVNATGFLLPSSGSGATATFHFSPFCQPNISQVPSTSAQTTRKGHQLANITAIIHSTHTCSLSHVTSFLAFIISKTSLFLMQIILGFEVK